ncbi:MAG: site-2 protease family protein [Candidatus Promineifilaceae bacterium]|nr:site-2 protease family protein [Candidatus Promineifilaceae bacterium]
MIYFLDTPTLIIPFIITAILAFAYHELAHALVADRLGDPTPRSYGRISLNPVVHLDRFGTILLLLVGFGWATTPVNPMRLRGNPRQSMAVVAVAGPAANLIMAFLWGLPLRLGLVEPDSTQLLSSLVMEMLQVGVWINVLLLAFNLMPIPPLDGFTILVGILPPELAYQLNQLRQYGTTILMLVIMAAFILPGNLFFDIVIGPVQRVLIPLLTGS